MTFYLVRRGHECLRLVGPCRYPEWSTTSADRMTHVQAVQASNAFGGEVVPIVEEPSPYNAMPKRVATTTDAVPSKTTAPTPPSFIPFGPVFGQFEEP